MDSEWDQHIDVLRTLYLSDDRKIGTLKSIMVHMKVTYNFDRRYVLRCRGYCVADKDSDILTAKDSTNANSSNGAFGKAAQPRTGRSSMAKSRSVRIRASRVPSICLGGTFKSRSSTKPNVTIFVRPKSFTGFILVGRSQASVTGGMTADTHVRNCFISTHARRIRHLHTNRRLRAAGLYKQLSLCETLWPSGVAW
jgi:hypothetical protein